MTCSYPSIGVQTTASEEHILRVALEQGRHGARKGHDAEAVLSPQRLQNGAKEKRGVDDVVHEEVMTGPEERGEGQIIGCAEHFEQGANVGDILVGNIGAVVRPVGAHAVEVCLGLSIGGEGDVVNERGELAKGAAVVRAHVLQDAAQNLGGDGERYLGRGAFFERGGEHLGEVVALKHED